jgi:hypothetical protein
MILKNRVKSFLRKLLIPLIREKQKQSISEQVNICRHQSIFYLPQFSIDIKSIPGMITETAGQYLFTIAFSQIANGDIVEIGSWQGKSTLYLAKAAMLSKNGIVHAVDHFKGNAGKESYYVVGKSDLSDLPSGFERNIAMFKLSNYVKQYAMDSKNAAELLHSEGISIRMLFIDGDHTYEGIRRDWQAWASMVIAGGIVVFDDFRPEAEGVVKFVNECIRAGKFSGYYAYSGTFVGIVA